MGRTGLRCFLIVSVIVNLILAIFLLMPFLVQSILAVPAPDNGSWGFISTDAKFTQATIKAMAKTGDKPLCTANSVTSLGLERFLFADGRLFNTDNNTAFIESLGGAKAFYARVSENPKVDAERLANAYRSEGFNAKVVEHYDEEMKGKMFFVTFKDSSYNPGWVAAFRLHGSKLGATKRWKE